MTDFSKPGTFTGKYDKFGSPVYVGDYIECLVTNGAEVKHLFGKVIVHPTLGENIYAIECKDPVLSEYYFFSDIFDISKRPDGKTTEFRKELISLIKKHTTEFRKELISLIKKHATEPKSNIFDTVLADYLLSACSDIFKQGVSGNSRAKNPDNITANLRVSSWSCPEPKRNRFFYDYPPEERIGRYSYFGVDNKGNKITLDIESKQNLDQNITIEIKQKEQI